MRVAFYAPLKPVDDPSPSGDRRMARSFKRLLGELGHDVRVVCRLRSFDKHGDPVRQKRLASLGARSADRLGRQFQRRGAWRPDLWFTYHAYHKAPDHIGPKLAQPLGIPYIVAEASIAGKQQHGRWRNGHEISLGAARKAAALIAMTVVDEWNLHRWVDDRARVHRLAPFIESTTFVLQLGSKDQHRRALAERFPLNPDSVWLVVAAMMRDDVKKQSYLALIEALAQVPADGWQILVIGDGPARDRIAVGFAGLGEDRAVLVGEVAETELPMMLAASDIYVWPAFDEAYGMAILEAQAAGLPVVVCREGGVPDIVVDRETGLILSDRSTDRFAAAISSLIGDEGHRRELSEKASEHVASSHDWQTARTRLSRVIDSAIASHQADRSCS